MNRRHRPRRRSCFLALTAGLAVILTSCSSSHQSGPATRTSSRPTATTRSSDPCNYACGTTSTAGSGATGATTTDQTHTGLVYDTTCGNEAGPETITFLDPDAGSPRSTQVFTRPDGTTTAYPSCPGGTAEHPVSPVEARQIFNHDYSRMAATDTTPDGGSHAGYLTAGGGFTDLTPSAGGFTSTPRATDPVFQPGTNVLWYLTGDPTNDASLPLFSIDTTTPGAPPESHGVVHDGPVLISTTGHVLLPRSVAPADWSSDQTFAALDGSELLHYDNEGGFILETTGHTTTYQEAASDGVNTCTPTAFITTTVILCADATTITLTGHTAAKASLIPKTDRTNFDATLSPDHNTVAFESLQGKTTQLYEVPATGGTPTLIPADLTTDGELIGWQ